MFLPFSHHHIQIYMRPGIIVKYFVHTYSYRENEKVFPRSFHKLEKPRGLNSYINKNGAKRKYYVCT